MGRTVKTLAPAIATLQEEPFEVVRVQACTPAIAGLSLRPVDAPLAYLPGQYVLVDRLDHTVPPRSYSVGNAPRADGMLTLLVTRIAGGATSPWLHRVGIGEHVAVSGPYGTFVDDPQATAPCLLLAAGSGLAPIRALLEAALAGTRTALTLVFSARTEADVIDAGRFLGWERDHPRFRFVRTLTRADGPPPTGRVPQILPDVCADLSGHDVFIAGPPGFIAGCTAAVTALGAARARVHTEAFFADPQPWS